MENSRKSMDKKIRDRAREERGNVEKPQSLCFNSKVVGLSKSESAHSIADFII
jgi:hypothetical protein